MGLRDVIGQDKAINILKRTVKKGKLPSAYLFAGESGIGKKLTAINLAKMVNCIEFNSKKDYIRDLKEIDSCDECSSCKKIDRGTHPDFMLIKTDGNQIKIEEIRAVGEFLSLKSYESAYKVVIIDEAEKLNQYAANAFLKTLEEPPAETLIILISSNPEIIPETITSRCSRINFRPLPLVDFKRLLLESLNAKGEVIEEGDKMGEDRINILIGISAGRPGLIITRDVFEERSWFLNLLNEMLNYGKDGWASREEMERWFYYLLVFLRDMTFLKYGFEDYIINIDMKDFLLRISKKVDSKIIINCYEKINMVCNNLSFNLNKSLTWNYTGAFLRNILGVTNG